MNIAIPARGIRQIDTLVGKRRRVAFLVQVVEKELRHIREFKAIGATEGRDLNRRDVKRLKELQQLPTIHLGAVMLRAHALHNLVTEGRNEKH